MLRITFASALALAMLTQVCLAFDGTAPKKEKQEETKAAPYESAATIDFGKSLDLNFRSLKTLGPRIEQSREAPDPVGLYSEARELAVAESVSGKQAALTSKALQEEAVKLAMLRSQSAELKALAQMAENPAVKKELLAAAKKADELAAKRKAESESGEVSRGILGQLIVNNHTHSHVDLYYNGSYVGCLDEHGHGHFSLHDHGHYFDLLARDHNGNVWRNHVHGDYNTYTWNLR
ncbi:hypothetical protein [Planctomicrobium sp. SH527]|uniref:hypothetical protein n=1 Tax=Planctomicrobium sp. SH527 TaxID=3448123 RepID=UPI003F5BE3B4